MQFFGVKTFDSIMGVFYRTMDDLSTLINRREDEIEDLNVVLTDKTNERDKARQVLQKMQELYGGRSDETYGS